MSEEKNHPQLKEELKQDGIIKKMPIYLSVGGEEKEIMVTYEIEPRESTGTCSVCRKENQKIVREVIKGDPKVDYDNPAVVSEAQEKIRKLINSVGEKMYVCEACFNDDFINRRPLRYIEAMKEASEELGIKIDLEGLSKAVRGAN